MKRHLTAALLTGALALGPTAAFAQDAEPVEPTTEETSSWDALGDALGEMLDTLLFARDELGEDPDAETQDAFDALVAGMVDAVANVFGEIYFEQVEAQALAVAENLEDEVEGEGANGEAVSTVAQCAPRGGFKGLIEGMGNHGEYVTAAAHGETVQLNVPTLEVGEDAESGETTYTVTPAEAPSDFDLTTVEGAEALCAALDTVYQARLLELELAWEDVDTHKDARVLVREQCKLQRLREKNGAEGDAKEYCAELRQRIKDLHAEERDARKADKAEEREQRKADREVAKQERAEARADKAAARGKNTD